MELEDLLLLKCYRVESHGAQIVAIQDQEGLYKAPSAGDLEKALNTRGRIRLRDKLFVRANPRAQWRPMNRH